MERAVLPCLQLHVHDLADRREDKVGELQVGRYSGRGSCQDPVGVGGGERVVSDVEELGNELG